MENKLSRNELTNLSLEALNKELKRISSLKCNLKKRKGIANKDAELADILAYDDLVKEVKYSLMNKGKSYFEFNNDDIEALSVEELVRFRKDIASKKCLDGNDPEVFDRCEELLDFSKQVLDAKRLEQDNTVVTKAKLRTLLDNYNMHQDVELLVASLEELAL